VTVGSGLPPRVTNSQQDFYARIIKIKGGWQKKINILMPKFQVKLYAIFWQIFIV
jgi:hypothetical protein